VEHEFHPSPEKLRIFTPEPPKYYVDQFFTAKGKARLVRLGQHVDRWIVWTVTQGMYRMDSNKRIYTYKGIRPTILHLASSEGMWLKVGDAYNFPQPILQGITETCNMVLEALQNRLNRYETKPKYKFFKCVFENLGRHPEFVQYQKHRGHEHKQFRWHYAEPPREGGNSKSAAKPVLLRKESVHNILKRYHAWLPPIQRGPRKKTKA